MITDLRGDVRTGQVRADVLAQVSVGQVLVLGQAARCTVTWFADGHREKVTGPARVTVTAAGLSGAPVERVRAAASLAAMRPRAAAGAARTAVTTRGPAEAVATLPAPVRVPAAAPMFRFPEDAVAVEVQGAGGEVLVADRLLGDPVWAVPARNPDTGGEIVLQPGVDYRVVALDRDGRVVSSRRFQVVPGLESEEALLRELEDLARMAPDDATPWIARAGMLEAAGLRELALDAVLEALALSPSPALLRWAAELSDQLGRPVEARVWRALAGDRQ